MPGIAQGFDAVRSSMPWWLLGSLTQRSGAEDIRDVINAYPQTAQVGTIVVTGATNDKAYIVTINSVPVTYTSDGTATIAEIANGLATKINEEPLVRGQVSASSNGVDTVTLTAVTPGIAFTASDVDAQLTTTAASTAAAAAAVVPFGRALVHQAYQNTDQLAALPTAALFSAQVITGTLSGWVTGAVYSAQVYRVVGGQRQILADVSETGATSSTVTLAALTTSLNAQLAAATVLVTSGATTITFTSEIPGEIIDVDLGVNDAGASVPTWAIAQTTGPSASTSLEIAFIGVSMRSEATAAITIAGTEQQYPANSCLPALRARGTIAVESAEAITFGDDVYVETAAGADTGKFFRTAVGSTTRVRLPRSRAVWTLDANTGTGNLAALRMV